MNYKIAFYCLLTFVITICLLTLAGEDSPNVKPINGYIGNISSISSTATSIKIAWWNGERWTDDSLGNLSSNFEIISINGRWHEVVKCKYIPAGKLLYDCERDKFSYSFLRGSIIKPIY